MAKSGKPSRAGDSRAEGSAATRTLLVEAAIETLKAEGFAGASARAIAARAQVNQALVFYHFGTVANLLLAALDEVSDRRLARYQEVVSEATTPSALAEVAETIFTEDLDAGHAKVLAEMVAGASSVPGLGEEVMHRIQRWMNFAETAIEKSVDPAILQATMPSPDLAYGMVAVYLGLEMMSQLDGDRTRALALFAQVKEMAKLADALGFLFSAKANKS